MSPQVRTEIDERIEALNADNHDGLYDGYINWLQDLLDEEA